MKQRRRSWIAPVIVAALALTACGSADDASSPPSSSGTDVAPPGDGAAIRPPTPIEVVSGGAGGASTDAQAVPASAESTDSGAITTEMVIAPWIVEYVVADDMPPLPTADRGYVFDAAVEVDAAQVAAVAAAFGVDGEPERIDDGYGVSWRVGPDDGSGPSVWVAGDGTASWNYNAAWDVSASDEACAVSIDADGNESSDCPDPVPPAGVPTAAEAEALARGLLEALRVDVATLTFDSNADEWFASVEASDRTEDGAAIRTWYFGFAGDGALQFAGGTLAVPQPVGPYPLVDLDTAVARLSDGFYGGFGGGVAIAEPAIAVESEVAADPAEGDQPEPVDTEPAPAPEEPTDEPVVETLPPIEPEPITVALVDVTADLWWAWDADGSVWLLPAYRFIDADGGWHVVPAVTDEFLIVTEPPVLDGPIPVEPDGGIGDGAEPLPVPEPEVRPEPDVPPPGIPDAIDEESPLDPEDAFALLEEFVGFSIEEFTVEAGALGFDTRIVQQDGEFLPVTADFSPWRVNVVVEGPRVIAIDSIG